jgi:gamma-glutamyltranspeptidase
LQKDGSPWFALGSPGSATIPNSVFQVIVNVIDYRMSLRDAIEYPRIHHQFLPDRVDAEPAALVMDVADRCARWATLSTRGCGPRATCTPLWLSRDRSGEWAGRMGGAAGERSVIKHERHFRNP